MSNQPTTGTKYSEFDDDEKKRSCCTRKVTGITLVSVGLFLVVVGIVYGTWLPNMLDNKISNGVAICGLDQVDDKFLNPHGDCETCVPYFYSFQPFSIINADEVVQSNGDVKLQVQEKGPYVYRKYSYKANVRFHEDQISYKAYHVFKYLPSQSCKGCSESDWITTIDVGYLKVMTSVGGEKQFIEKIFEGILKKKLHAAGNATKEVTNAIKAQIDGLKALPSVQKMFLKVFSGLNSLHPQAMDSSLNALAAFQDEAGGKSPTERLADFTGHLESFQSIEFSGLFLKRPLKHIAMGYPGMFAGIATTAELLSCKTMDLSADFCAADPVKCKTCKTALIVEKANNAYLCDQMIAYLTSISNKELASSIGERTCKKCGHEGGYCVAPIPGAVAERDYNVLPVDLEMIPETTLMTGCDSKDKINQYVQSEGVTEFILWNKTAPVDRNPTMKELQQFGTNASCENEQVHCERVSGGDGASFPPAGADMSGLKTTPAFESSQTFIMQAKQSLLLEDSGETHVAHGIELNRLIPSNDVLHRDEKLPYSGRGVPVNGVVNLAYNTGFLAYLSYPFFMFGDYSLLDNVEMYFKEDSTKRASKANMYTNDVINKNVYDRYRTYIDVEPSTGKTMHAQKRLMASYGIAAQEDNQVVTDVLMDKLTPNLIVPVYWAEERVTVTPVLADTFKSVEELGKSIIPVMFIAILLGAVGVAIGAFLVVQFKRQQRQGSVDL